MGRVGIVGFGSGGTVSLLAALSKPTPPTFGALAMYEARFPYGLAWGGKGAVGMPLMVCSQAAGDKEKMGKECAALAQKVKLCVVVPVC